MQERGRRSLETPPTKQETVPAQVCRGTSLSPFGVAKRRTQPGSYLCTNRRKNQREEATVHTATEEISSDIPAHYLWYRKIASERFVSMSSLVTSECFPVHGITWCLWLCPYVLDIKGQLSLAQPHTQTLGKHTYTHTRAHIHTHVCTRTRTVNLAVCHHSRDIHFTVHLLQRFTHPGLSKLGLLSFMLLRS